MTASIRPGRAARICIGIMLAANAWLVYRMVDIMVDRVTHGQSIVDRVLGWLLPISAGLGCLAILGLLLAWFGSRVGVVVTAVAMITGIIVFAMMAGVRSWFLWLNVLTLMVFLALTADLWKRRQTR